MNRRRTEMLSDEEKQTNGSQRQSGQLLQGCPGELFCENIRGRASCALDDYGIRKVRLMEPLGQPKRSRYQSILRLVDRLNGSEQLFEQAAEIVAEIEGSVKQANGIDISRSKVGETQRSIYRKAKTGTEDIMNPAKDDQDMVIRNSEQQRKAMDTENAEIDLSKNTASKQSFWFRLAGSDIGSK